MPEVNFMDTFKNSEEFKPLLDAINGIMELPEEDLNDTIIEALENAVDAAITPAIMQSSVEQITKNLETEGMKRSEAIEALKYIKDEVKNYINSLAPSEIKQKLLDRIFKGLYNVFDTAIDQYHNYNIVLPIQLEEGAIAPTYAHIGDAAADLYAADTVTLPAHSISTMIRTGVHIGLPEGWVALIWPRSSIGMKTGLRLSNSTGVIDSGYRGQLGVIYDNISDSDYTIKAGDRIAQLLVMPSYRFKAKVVENLDETERGEGGFGSTGV